MICPTCGMEMTSAGCRCNQEWFKWAGDPQYAPIALDAPTVDAPTVDARQIARIIELLEEILQALYDQG